MNQPTHTIGCGNERTLVVSEFLSLAGDQPARIGDGEAIPPI